MDVLALSASYPDRLNTSARQRISSATGGSFILGASLGAWQGGSVAALRFRAENSHRLPRTQRGWFFYHRAKNTWVLRESITEAALMGCRLAPWVGLFFLVEHAVDETREDLDAPGVHRDFLATTVAGLSVAGAFGAAKRLPFPTAARMCKLGLLTGLAYGLAQDAIRVLRGERLAYVDLLKRIGSR